MWSQRRQWLGAFLMIVPPLVLTAVSVWVWTSFHKDLVPVSLAASLAVGLFGLRFFRFTVRTTIIVGVGYAAGLLIGLFVFALNLACALSVDSCV